MLWAKGCSSLVALVVVACAVACVASATHARAASVDAAADAAVPMWGDANTEVDELDQHHELVLLEEGLDTADAAADDEQADDEAEAEAEADADADAGVEDEAEDEDETEAVYDGAALAVEPEHSYHSAASIAAVVGADALTSGSGMADTPAPASALMEMPLAVATWARLVADSRGYASNVLRANARSGVRGGPCAGVIGANCKHTADMQGALPDAEKWQDECAKLICNPLCLRYTWDVKIVASGGPEGFEDAVNALGTQHSLGAQFRAHACAKVAGCCEENDDLLQWVELRGFAGMFPENPQPTLACDLRANAGNEEQTPSKEELCDQCKAAIEVEAEPKEDACDAFVKVPDPADMGDEIEVFARNGVAGAAQIPKHKSFKEKCDAVQALMAGIISGLASGEWKEKACSCLGCCEASPGSECYYPVTYGTTDEAHAAHKS